MSPACRNAAERHHSHHMNQHQPITNEAFIQCWPQDWSCDWWLKVEWWGQDLPLSIHVDYSVVLSSFNRFGFQDYLLHHLHRPKVRLSSPVIPWILLEDRINIYLLT